MANKIINVVIQDKEYNFSVETSGREKTYIVKPQQSDEWLDKHLHEQFEFTTGSEEDNEAKSSNPEERELRDAIWRAIKEQVINDHPGFNRPLN